MITELKRFGARMGLAAVPAAVSDDSDTSLDAPSDGAFASFGPTDTRILELEGFRPTDTILDFGCRSGRLAVEIIPKLHAGHYIGADLSDSLLDRARTRVRSINVESHTRVTWIKQTSFVFPLGNRMVDLFCAFDAFMHIEHEDTFRYLKTARRVVKPGGRLLLSCLPMNLPLAQSLFIEGANHSFGERWGGRRIVTTSVDLMESIARLSGWQILRWHSGDQRNVKIADEATRQMVGSTLVLQNPTDS